jgi:SAM-dependent methyltransferase
VEAYSRLAGVYDEIVVDPCFPLWAAFLDRLWQGDAAGVRSVLDVCCGTGLLAAELIGRGYRVAGIDASQAMLARARTLLGPDVSLVHVTLPDLPVDEIFDAAISTFDGLNYLTPADFRLSLAAIAGRIRPGGWLVFDLHTDAMLAMAAAHPVIEGDEDGNHYVIRNVVDATARTCEAHIEISRARDGSPFSERHLQFFHTDEQVRDALDGAGLDLTQVVDEYSPVPAGAATLRATWIARRRV